METTGGAAEGAPPAAITASMSCLLMRPPAPVPATVEGSIPCSLAMRRTSGELWMRSPDEAGVEAAADAGATARGATGRGTGVAAADGAAAPGAFAGAGASIWDFAGAGAEAGAGDAVVAPAASMTPTTV